MLTNITIFGLDVEMEEPNEILYNYIYSFFDFDSLIYYIKLTGKGIRKYKVETTETKIQAVLMCTKNNKDFRKYDMFYLKCEEFEKYYNELFLGFDRYDINIAIAKLVAKYTEDIKRQSYGL